MEAPLIQLARAEHRNATTSPLPRSAETTERKLARNERGNARGIRLLPTPPRATLEENRPRREFDSVSWTSSERWIRCPEWDQRREGDARDDSSLRSSWSARSGWCWMRAKRSGAVARELDLTPSALAQWVKQARADRTRGKTGADDRGTRRAGAPTQRQSRAADGARRPKKAAAFFAKDHL